MPPSAPPWIKPNQWEKTLKMVEQCILRPREPPRGIPNVFHQIQSTTFYRMKIGPVEKISNLADLGEKLFPDYKTCKNMFSEKNDFLR